MNYPNIPNEKAFISHAFENVGDFIDALRLSGHTWTTTNSQLNPWETSWIFRGQMDATLPLTPKLWRNKTNLELERLIKLQLSHSFYETIKPLIEKMSSELNQSGNVNQIERITKLAIITHLEFSLLTSFIKQMEERGLSSSYGLSDWLDGQISSANLMEFIRRICGEPNQNIDSILLDMLRGVHQTVGISLAQHHGIPTRLLDWSTNPLIAAFFAAYSYLNQPINNPSTNYIGVFCIKKNSLHGLTSQIEVFQFPRSENAFLHSQNGILTIMHGSFFYLKNGYFPSISDLIQETEEVDHWQSHPKPRMFTLPASQASALIKHLWRYEHISIDMLMPSLDNIARATMLKKLLQLGG